MTNGLQTIIYPATDIDAAKTLFSTLLGAEPTMDQPYYVGYEVAGQSVGLDPNGHRKGMTGPTGYWHVEDIAKTRDELVAAGAVSVDDVRDVGGGRLIATLEDTNGNVIGLLQP